MGKTLAIANCRVSSDEQLLNNSLNRQKQAVINAADKLGVTIPEDGWWSGSVSSKKGNNLNRKDIQQMLDYCRAHRAVKYLIVDEPDRFMRSTDEAIYFEVQFKQLGVQVWYASDDELNNDNLHAKLLKFMKYFVAEGSNDERQRKSINGQVQAIKEGRYPFRPKVGYKKGTVDGVHILDQHNASIIRDLLARIAAQLVTPTQALKELNESNFTMNHSPYKMDKFRNIITDPYYAGIVEMDKQVKARNELGLHEPLISIEQHKEIVRIMDNKRKVQSGPAKNGNPDFPLDNILFCDNCKEISDTNRFVGFNHTNGVTPKIYQRYRCRTKGCSRYLHAEQVHKGVEHSFIDNPMTDTGKRDLCNALETVWKQREQSTERNTLRLEREVEELNKSILNQIEALSDPANASLQDEIRSSIAKKKQDIESISDKIIALKEESKFNKTQFMDFALDYVDNLSTHFFELSRDKQLLCKQLVFPAGFWVDENKNVYTPEVSELYRLATKKRDTNVSQKSLMVRVQGL